MALTITSSQMVNSKSSVGENGLHKICHILREVIMLCEYLLCIHWSYARLSADHVPQRQMGIIRTQPRIIFQ